jgi:predicted phage terminase large subunit-like protein
MWRILYLPAIDEAGNALWPEYFSLEKLLAIKREMGSALFSAMYLGRPELLSGLVFRKEWFRLCRFHPGTDGLFIELDGELLALEELLIIQGWDLAISEKQGADYTVGLTLGIHPASRRLVVLDVSRARRSFDKTQRDIAALGDAWNPYVVAIEKVAYQAAAVQEAVRRTLLPIREAKVDTDKVTRARLPAALAESGKLFIVQAPWNQMFFDELVDFPSGRFDDQVDALSLACATAATYVPSEFLLWNA